MNMGASFNKTSWRLKGHVIGTEARVSLVNCCTMQVCGFPLFLRGRDPLRRSTTSAGRDRAPCWA